MRATMRAVAIGLWATTTLAAPASAQMAVPDAAAPDGAKLFKNQCATCHTVHASDPKRQGPTMEGIYGRKAGSVADFHYSAGFAKADWTWDDAHLDPWLSNPQAVIPGAIMAYHQNKAEIRTAIIGYLKELH